MGFFDMQRFRKHFGPGNHLTGTGQIERVPEGQLQIKKNNLGSNYGYELEKTVDTWTDVSPRTKKSSFLKTDSAWRPWSAFENNFIAIIINVLAEQLRRLLGLEDYSNIGNDAQFWFDMDLLFGESVKEIVSQVAQQAAKDAVDQIAITVSYEMTSQVAKEWALLYAASRIRKVNETTKEAVRQAIAEWIQSGRGIGELREKLQSLTDDTGMELFSEGRAKRIAQTELTTIYANAKAKALEANGYRTPAFLPAAHPNCRCYIQPATAPDGTKVIVWYTARDEMVCTREIETPFGKVQGCRELHRTIVSEGYTGMKLESNQWNPEKSLYLKGSEGSGNFGHAERPGKVGGSQRSNNGKKQFDYIDPDTGINIKAYKDEEGFYRNAEEIIVYWGSNVPPSKLAGFKGGSKDSSGSNSGKNHFVTLDIEAAKGFAEIMKERSGGKMWLYTVNLKPGEGWLPYHNPSKGDGIELAVDIEKSRIEVYASELSVIPGEWTKGDLNFEQSIENRIFENNQQNLEEKE